MYTFLIILGFSAASVMCLSRLGLQGSDHHEGSAERGSDWPQPAEEKIRCPFHALPSDSPQNY